MSTCIPSHRTYRRYLQHCVCETTRKPLVIERKIGLIIRIKYIIRDNRFFSYDTATFIYIYIILYKVRIHWQIDYDGVRTVSVLIGLNIISIIFGPWKTTTEKWQTTIENATLRKNSIDDDEATAVRPAFYHCGGGVLHTAWTTESWKQSVVDVVKRSA